MRNIPKISDRIMGIYGKKQIVCIWWKNSWLCIADMVSFLQTIESDITVAVMGCVVNGPGEAREADIGIAGGVNEGMLFKKGKTIKKVQQEKIVETLKEEILNMIKE